MGRRSASLFDGEIRNLAHGTCLDMKKPAGGGRTVDDRVYWSISRAIAPHMNSRPTNSGRSSKRRWRPGSSCEFYGSRSFALVNGLIRNAGKPRVTLQDENWRSHESDKILTF